MKLMILMLLAGCSKTDKNDPLAHVRLQVKCGEGDKGACDEVERLDREGCTKGNGHSCNLLGISYEVGKFVPQDYVRAAELHARGCALGDAPSCWYAGMMLQQGRGIPEDPAGALPMFQKACDGGHDNGCLSLGQALEKNDRPRARQAYEKGCALHYQSACDRAAALK